MGLTLALDKAKTSELAIRLELFGSSVHRTGTDIFADGPDVKMRMISAGARAGIKRVDLRLRDAVRFFNTDALPSATNNILTTEADRLRRLG